MKYDITYKCNHEGVVELFGKNSERERRIAYLETTLCSECAAIEHSARVIKQTADTKGAWVEMHYGKYKKGYSGCLTRDYNAETKTIMVFISEDFEIVSKLKAIGLPEEGAKFALENGSDCLKQGLAEFIEKNPNPQGQDKENIEKMTAAIDTLLSYGK